MKQKMYIIVISVTLLALVLSGCTGISSIGSGSSSIKDITTNPGKYEGKVVTVSGKVISVNPVDGIGYKINDGEASIMVRSNKKSPNVGDEVTVKGTVVANSIGIGIDATANE